MTELLAVCVFVISFGAAAWFVAPLPDMLCSHTDCVETLHNPKIITVVYGTNTENVTEVCYNFTNYSYCTYGPRWDRQGAYCMEYTDESGKTKELNILGPKCVEVPNGNLTIYV